MAGLVDFSLGDIGTVFTSIREAITGEKIKDPAQMAKIELDLRKLEQMASDGQISINREEAKHPSIFVAGWRPFIGWVCGFAIAYNYIVQPTIIWIANFMHYSISTPTLDLGVLISLVLAMLGIGGLRSFDKLKGIDTKQISNIKPTTEEKY